MRVFTGASGNLHRGGKEMSPAVLSDCSAAAACRWHEVERDARRSPCEEAIAPVKEGGNESLSVGCGYGE